MDYDSYSASTSEENINDESSRNSSQNSSSNLLIPPPKIEQSAAENLVFAVPPDTQVNTLHWRELNIPPVPTPDNTEVANEFASKFDLANLFRQIKTV